MKIRNFAAISFLVISSFAANSAAPSKTELEGMYDKAFRKFDSNNYAEALKDLDAIDARQPDLAESQNLRGVIMMRQKDYPAAEAALKKALAADPKFWNARFNLAEIPFLEKNWVEARKRFQELLNGNASELQGEATQLIQYKILLTYLLEGKEDMVASMLAKFELSPDAPAVHYANAALALNKKDENGAKEWLTKAEKNFSPQLNKLFAESLYEVGWLEKPAGQARAALELNSAADRAAQTKDFAQAKYEQAEQAFAQRDLTAARKLVDEANGAAPNDARVLNLRGEILLEQKEFDQAEAEFRKALKADPKSRDAQFNLAQVPFKKKDYGKARDRFESLFSVTSGADKDQAAQLIKFKIFLTLLLEGKDARAQKMMEQFQFTGDTPALYYAQAATEFKNNNTAKANEWVTSARKIYSPALNGIFSESFFDLGWLQSPGVAAPSPAPMIADAEQAETAPAIEPTPLPAVTLAQNSPAQNSNQLALATNSAVPGMEATTSSASSDASTASRSVGAAAASASSPSVETPVASTAPPAAARPVIANGPKTESSNANETSMAPARASSTPATVLAPAQVREWSQPSLSERIRDGNTLLVAGLLMAGILLLGWVVMAEFRRSMMRTSGRINRATAPLTTATTDEAAVAIEQFVTPARLAGGPPQVSLQLRASEPALRRGTMPLAKSGRATGNGTSVADAPRGHVAVEPQVFVAPAAETFVGAVSEPAVAADGAFTSSVPADVAGVAEPGQSGVTVADQFIPPVDLESDLVSAPADVMDDVPAAPRGVAPTETVEAFAGDLRAPISHEVVVPAEASFDSAEQLIPIQEPVAIAERPSDNLLATPEAEVPSMDVPQAEMPPISVSEEAAPIDVPEAAAPQICALEEALPMSVLEEEAASGAPEEFAAPVMETQPISVPEADAAPTTYESPDTLEAAPEPDLRDPRRAELPAEPIGQGQPVPYQVPAAEPEATSPDVPPPAPEKAADPFSAGLAAIGALRHFVTNRAPIAPVTTNEPMAQQPTTLEVMPPTSQPTPAPVIRTSPPSGMPQPSAGMQVGAPQPAGGAMHTAVQLTFSFEIASLQLTPTFKMGALQLKPTSKIVTMRLAPSQNPQPAMNLQVTFEIASVQLNGNSLGVIRLTPSQQQRPGITSSPAFNISGLQLVSGAESAPVQLTPSQQGQASVLVTAGFQIATVEFSPTFEIASIILNSNSRNVNVQLPGTGPSAVEGAPVFEITNVQLSGNGEIGMMHLNPPGTGSKVA